MSTENEIIEQHPEWKEFQIKIKSKLEEKDRIISLDEIDYICGMYIYDCNKSLDKNYVTVGISIINFYSGKVEYSMSEVYTTDIPYITGYIGFREVHYLKKYMRNS